jgi:uncharacterized metal-binding protein YceD (DUF177 family)
MPSNGKRERSETLHRIDLGSVIGAGRELEIRDAIEVPDFGSYRFAGPAQVALVARKLGRGIELRGSVEATALGECARCLDDVSLPLHLELDERLEIPYGDDGDGDPFAETNILTGDELDLADLIRQTLDAALPLSLACGPTCAGLCPTCGEKRDGTCRCAATESQGAPNPDPTE